MNRRQFLEYTAVTGVLAGAAAFGEGKPAATQAEAPDSASDRMRLVAYCGLYCGLCDWRSRLPERAAVLKESLALAESPAPKPVQQFLDGLSQPDKEGKFCRGGKCGARCAIKKCAIAKGVAVCAECREYPCGWVKTLARSEPTLIHDGERIRKIGLDAWVQEQEERKARGFCYADVRCLSCTVPQE